MEKILIEEKYVLEYIKEKLLSFKDQAVIINGARYHHNTSYIYASSVCKHGILSLRDMNELGIIKLTKETLEIMNDIESHTNGIDKVSLAVCGLADLYDYEEEYDPRSSELVDFLVSSDIEASRNSNHYGNEFCAPERVKNIDIKSVDIRLLKYIKALEERKTFFTSGYTLEDAVKKYNALRNIALAIKKYNLDIPLREMSLEENHSMDINKIIKSPEVIIKRMK